MLGFDDLASTSKESPYFGATVGRVANRIRDAKFELEGKNYELAANDGPHHLHGGNKGWDKVVWDAETSRPPTALDPLHLRLEGRRGGLPRHGHGELHLHADEQQRASRRDERDHRRNDARQHAPPQLLEPRRLRSGPITDHELTLFADKYTPGDPTVPTGEDRAVKGTPFDFTHAKPIGKDLKAAGGKPDRLRPQLRRERRAEHAAPRRRARGSEVGARAHRSAPTSPACSFTAGNSSTDSSRARAGSYAQYAGFASKRRSSRTRSTCPPGKDVILEAGQTYKHTMIHRFTTLRR